jgi:solute carrier family 25 S-adenosylmethionine transporter 26
VLKEAPDAAVFLALSEAMSSSLLATSPWFATHLTATLLLSGAFGDACGSILRLPPEVVGKRQQTGVSGADCWRRTLMATSREHWLASWSTILARDVPFGALQIAAYQQARCFVVPACSSFSEMAPDSFSDVVAGVLAGALAAALTTPLDVLVTQATTADLDSKGPPRSTWQLGVDLVREQGPQTLLRGIGYRTLYYAPLVGCFFGLYEYFRVILEDGSLGG